MADDKAPLKTDPATRSQATPHATREGGSVSPSSPTVLPRNHVETDKAKPFDSSYQNTLFGSAGTEERPAWSDSMEGRATIRLFSRGIVGALFFTAAGRLSRHQLLDYNPNTFSFKTAEGKPLQILAKAFDIVFGVPIQSMTRLARRATGATVAEAESAAWNAVNFRTKAYYHEVGGMLTPHKKLPMNGRSLGAEMVGVTFDFAMASVGDASTRNFIQLLDPNIRKPFILNDKGETAQRGEKSHFDSGKFVRFVGKTAWRIFSNNQGEDWFAALPYVYQMKAQRGLMTGMFKNSLKGSKIMFDNNWNGGAYKINQEGQIVGDYQMAGAADLHFRFVGYNVYTLMFREGYDAVANSFKHWKENGYHVQMHLPEHPLSASLDGLRNSARYVAKSVIKASIYMTPAVVPFWLFRTPQTKWRGALIHPEAAPNENAVASRVSWKERVDFTIKEHAAQGRQLSFQEAEERMVMKNTIHNYETTKPRIWPTGQRPPFKEEPVMFMGRNPEPIANPTYAHEHPYKWEMYDHYPNKTWTQKIDTGFSKMLNPFGKFSYWLGDKAAGLPQYLPKSGIRDFISEGTDFIPGKPNVKAHQFMHNFIDASVAYTPYMFAKSELALHVDDRKRAGKRGLMDQAIYKFIDNVCAFNTQGMSSSVKEIWHLSTHNEESLRSREWSDIPQPQPTLQPVTSVQADGLEHQPPAQRSEQEKNTQESDDKNDRSWAEAIAGRKLAAQFQPTTPQTRH